MSDADLIYSACLRAERRLGAEIERLKLINRVSADETADHFAASLRAVQTIREEIGNAFAAQTTETRP